MAGTGHPYEIANPGAVEEALAAWGERSPTAKRWLATRHVRRFVTGAPFTVALEQDPEGRALIEAGAPEGPGRDATLAKLAEGGDIRVFVATYLRAAGPDIGHVLDWIDSLDRSGDRMAARIERVAMPQAVAAADRWSAAIARESAAVRHVGRIEAFVAGRGSRWWVELLDGAALSYESARMDHCVRDYRELLGRGTRIFSLRSGDAPFVTVEVIEGVSGVRSVRQVRAHGNRVPDNALRRDVAALLCELGCTKDLLREAAALGVELGSDGVWRTFDEVGIRARVEGLDGIGFGPRFYVSSRSDPEAFVATAIGEEGWWERPDGRFRVLSANGNRAVRIADLRRLAAFADARRDSLGTVDCGLVRGGDGSWTVWPDTMVRHDFGAAVCLERKDGATLVVRASEITDVLMTLRRARAGAVLEPQELPERRWSAADVRIVTAALNGLGNAVVHDRQLSSAGLRRDPDGRWLLWEDECERKPYLGDVPDGRPLQWETTDWCLELVGPSRSPLVTVTADAEGRVRTIVAPFASERHLLDLVRLLNETGMPMAPSLHADAMHLDRFAVGAPADALLVVRADGRWSLVKGDGMVAYLAGLGRRQFADPGLNEFAVAYLPPHGSDAAADTLLARHLANLLANADRASLLSRLGFENRWRSRTVRGSTGMRLAAAAALMPLMSARERKAVAVVATKLLRDTLGRRRKPTSIVHWSGDVARMIVRAFWRDLPAPLLERAVPYALYIGTLHSSGENGEPVIEREWVEILSVAGPNARHAIREAAGFGSYVILGSEPKLPTDPEAWATWVETVEACAHDGWRGERLREAKAVLLAHGTSMGWVDDPQERMAA